MHIDKMRNPRPPPLSSETKQLMVERRAALRGPDRDLYTGVNRCVRAAMHRDARESIGRQIAAAGRSAMYYWYQYKVTTGFCQ